MQPGDRTPCAAGAKRKLVALEGGEGHPEAAKRNKPDKQYQAAPTASINMRLLNQLLPNVLKQS